MIEQDLKDSLIDVLRQWFIKSQLTQKELGLILKIGKPHISRLLSGNLKSFSVYRN